MTVKRDRRRALGPSGGHDDERRGRHAEASWAPTREDRETLDRDARAIAEWMVER